MNDLAEIERLIADHDESIRDMDKVFDKGDEDGEWEVIDRMDSALIALCAARPTTEAAATRRREFLSAVLVDRTDATPGLMQKAYDALLGVPEAIPATETCAGAAGASSGSTNSGRGLDAASGRPVPKDPILIAIEAYREGSAAYAKLPEFNSQEDELAAAAVTYGPPTETLQQWDVPAFTLAGAIEALRLAEHEIDHGDPNIATSMVTAALRYLEGDQS